MKLAIMQPYFMPYIGYFQLMNAVDKFLLYDKVDYIKKGWINRNRILVQNIGDKYITVPVKNVGRSTKISDVIIDNSSNWRKVIKDIIYYNYKRSDCFEEIYSVFSDCIDFECNSISEYNGNLLITLSNLLNINSVECLDSTDYNDIELLMSEYSDSSIRRMDRIINICNVHNADCYINPIGGITIYEKEYFNNSNIKLNFLKTHSDIIYKQYNQEFISNLSILDVLFNNGIEGTQKLLIKYELI